MCKWQGQKSVEKMTAEMGETSHRKWQEKEAVKREMQQWHGRLAQWGSMVHEMDLYERSQSWKEYNKVVANYKQWEEAQRTSDGAGSCSSTTTTEINRIRQQQGNLLRFKGTLGRKKMLVLIDSGATGNFISQNYCERNGIR